MLDRTCSHCHALLVCRRCSGWLVQPMPGWSLSDWIRSAIVEIYRGVCALCNTHGGMQQHAAFKMIGPPGRSILIHPRHCVSAGAILCTLCTAGTYSTGTGRWVPAIDCVSRVHACACVCMYFCVYRACFSGSEYGKAPSLSIDALCLSVGLSMCLGVRL